MAEKLWFGTSNKPYDRNNIRYYRTTDYSWALDIEEKWQELKPEISQFIASTDAHFISNENAYKGLKSVKGWHSVASIFWGLIIDRRFEKNCPKTYKALCNIPGIVSISFSKLEPGTEISKHHGETNAIIRCHLGVEVPATAPDCAMNVNSEIRGWQEGKWIFFNDAQEHRAWNHTDKRRIVIIIDVIRPEFKHLKNLICARSLAEYAIGKRENKYEFISKLPLLIKKLLIYSGTLTIYLAKPFLNLIRHL